MQCDPDGAHHQQHLTWPGAVRLCLQQSSEPPKGSQPSNGAGQRWMKKRYMNPFRTEKRLGFFFFFFVSFLVCFQGFSSLRAPRELSPGRARSERSAGTEQLRPSLCSRPGSGSPSAPRHRSPHALGRAQATDGRPNGVPRAWGAAQQVTDDGGDAVRSAAASARHEPPPAAGPRRARSPGQGPAPARLQRRRTLGKPPGAARPQVPARPPRDAVPTTSASLILPKVPRR